MGHVTASRQTFSAALAGRQLAGRLMPIRWMPLAVVPALAVATFGRAGRVYHVAGTPSSSGTRTC